MNIQSDAAHARVSEVNPRFSLSVLLTHLMRGLRVHTPMWFTEIIAINAAFLAVAFVRYGGRIPTEYSGRRGLVSLVLITVSYTLFDLAFHAYRVLWRFASVLDMFTLALTVLGTVVTIGAVELGPLAGDRPLPLSVLALGGAMAYLVLAHLKLVPTTRHAVAQAHRGQPLIIFGAGTAGITLVHQLAHEKTDLRPVAFIDDDPQKRGRHIAGLPVAGPRAEMGHIVRRFNAQAVAIAVPSADSATIRDVTNLAIDSDARALVLPSLAELLSGRELRLRDVGMEDLVGRSEVQVDEEGIRAAFAGKRVLLTGAAGSIGSELARQIRALGPAALMLLDNNETGLAELRDELPTSECSLDIVVGSITDEVAVTRTFSEAQPDIVIHAAALKHVDILEEQPASAARVNVLGTWLCAQAAERAGAERFIFISTDKAADPVGVLGATKHLGELMMRSMDRGTTIFAAVRFGNVLGSRGSVQPKFERQIEDGGPITVTHPKALRFFMSITEAVRLVLQSAAFAEPGRTYVLDMGEEMSIDKFARRLARLRGLRVPQDIDVVYTGLRPGERMTEKLVGADETPLPTSHPRVLQVCAHGPMNTAWSGTIEALLDLAAAGDGAALRAQLLQLCAEQSVASPTS